ncbi:MAG: hypothetical protein B7X65_17110 [Polaromonas sp. 39-63-25]|nr:MAG: hypothetical protein B7Y60_18410 [Polaromonas sp. 35-63-35]OYZ18145.1 MAG: hypothetical protein B7Y28_16885 [Polaromonas sp. 16-63-31]OYZ77131.1 MAG: hypothetical protein B7Y09_17730 [Polaromonas sp. 24-63-21]OZA51218.1 MAG: hypothetical protein B7X88_06220 [Polaromonas sp. 17-63-33]OZA86455.1 MAG: hypothetical protein B7X65_17110 [Polaromonas sp. 39-63-25]
MTRHEHTLPQAPLPPPNQRQAERFIQTCLGQRACGRSWLYGAVDLTRFRRHISASSAKLLECQRAQRVEMTVLADSIAETLDVTKHVWPCIVPSWMDLRSDRLQKYLPTQSTPHEALPA